MEKEEKTEKTEKTIYDLELHETFDVNTKVGSFQVIRVQSGWLYRFYHGGRPYVNFVPYNKDMIDINSNDFEFSIK